jgi:hypothetical protein
MEEIWPDECGVVDRIALRFVRGLEDDEISAFVFGVGIFFVWPGCSGDTTPSMARQPSPHLLVRSFDRFDEITDLVENASDLTLARRRRVRRAVPTRLPESSALRLDSVAVSLPQKRASGARCP